MQLYSSLSILWHCLSLGLEWKLTFSSPVATAEFSKFASILSAALSQHHISGFEKAQLESHIPADSCSPGASRPCSTRLGSFLQPCLTLRSLCSLLLRPHCVLHGASSGHRLMSLLKLSPAKTKFPYWVNDWFLYPKLYSFSCLIPLQDGRVLKRGYWSWAGLFCTRASSGTKAPLCPPSLVYREKKASVS